MFFRLRQQAQQVILLAARETGQKPHHPCLVLARHLARHIPGNPVIVVQNMSGASSLVAANYLYKIAKPDGLTFGGVRSSLYFDQLVGRKEVQFDWAKFTWLGSPTQSNQLLYMRANTPYKTIYDVRKAAVAPKCGTSGTAASGYYIPHLLNETLGTKFNVITGYKDGPETDLAVEKEEIHCRAISLETLFVREPFITWRKNGFVRVLIQTGTKRDPRLPDVPTLYELMNEFKTPEISKRLATVIVASGIFGRPFIAMPGIQPDRVKILQTAFMKALSDSALLAEANDRKLEIDPVAAEELETLAREVMTQLPEVIEKMKQVLGN